MIRSAARADYDRIIVWAGGVPSRTLACLRRLSGAVFQPSKGFDDLFAQEGGGSRFYSVLGNFILAF